jgi:hypothetical protein
MGIARSTYYDRPEKPGDDTAPIWGYCGPSRDVGTAPGRSISGIAPWRARWTNRSSGFPFIGPLASVVYSEKCCGTNHTLPRMQARYANGLCVGSYVKICPHQ